MNLFVGKEATKRFVVETAQPRRKRHREYPYLHKPSILKNFKQGGKPPLHPPCCPEFKFKATFHSAASGRKGLLALSRFLALPA